MAILVTATEVIKTVMKYAWQTDESLAGKEEKHIKQVTMGQFQWSAKELLMQEAMSICYHIQCHKT